MRVLRLLQAFVIITILGMTACTGGAGDSGDVAESGTEVKIPVPPECENITCDEDATCKYEFGAPPYCECHPGFHGDGYTCADLSYCVLTSQMEDHDADEYKQVDRRTTAHYDENGNVVEIVESLDLYTQTMRINYSYDANGKIAGSEVDADADGEVDFWTTNTYDANGNLVRTEGDSDGDGVVDSFTVWTYDDQGNALSSEADFDADGVADSRTSNTYDANGNLLSHSWDLDADGDVDERHEFTYDAAGKVLSHEKDSVNPEGKGADGVMDFRTTYTYDENGNMVLRERDSSEESIDGVVDGRATYTYDQRGNMLSEDCESARSSVHSSMFFWDTLFGASLLPWEGDSCGSRKTFSYSASELLTKVETDEDKDGVVDSRITYWWECMGVLITP